uniref:NADH:ubiquinone reductase (H(+)-translocating) n=1 Tax=Allodiplogaster sudhausi TaxID=2761625 RepID=A0A0U3B233_9BILA|nr:NADH dehydrogenase subunit 5 [Allodiplogaster sudhausi]ALT06542.1 NADH dehydrogenase subunit 5 [Allodiplogaster sudhausi]
MEVFIFLISLMFLFMLIVVSMIPYLNVSFNIMEWDFISLKFNLYYNSILFSFILMVVTMSVLLYSTFYLNSELNFSYFCFILLLFVGSMFLLNFSNSVFTMMLSWDLLGITSFFLVLFYNNWDSCSGAMNTVLMNRLGDYFMFVFFSSSVFSGYYFLSFSYFNYYMVVLLVLTAFTKSAQFPFSSWLPKAMSAPTPVSSLVHSSTLVTAGLILLGNFNYLLMHKNVLSMLLLFGIFTMFFSSVAALVEEDLKKVVALSTLSQMGFSIMTMGLGLGFISLIHLVSHALFKSCLFMQVGYFIHSSFGQQDGRSYNNNGNLPYFVQLQMVVTLFCLCGLIFTSGCVSKDLILEMFFYNNFMMFLSIMFFFSVFLTFGYSYRMWKSLYLSFNNVFSHFSSSIMMNFLSLILVLMSIMFLWWLNLNMLNIPSMFLLLDFYTPLMYLSMIILISFVCLKILSKELIYKFFLDYFAKVFPYKLKNMKFMDLMLNNMISMNFNLSGMLSNTINLIMKGSYYNNLVLIMILMFIMF